MFGTWRRQTEILGGNTDTEGKKGLKFYVFISIGGKSALLIQTASELMPVQNGPGLLWNSPAIHLLLLLICFFSSSLRSVVNYSSSQEEKESRIAKIDYYLNLSSSYLV